MNHVPITAFDLVVGAVILLSAVVALARGAFQEILRLISWIGALASAYYGFPLVRPMIREAVGNDLLTDLATAALVFVVPLVVLRLLVAIVARRIEREGTGMFDRLVGLAYGLARGAFLVSAGFLIASILVGPANMPGWVKRGWSYGYVRQGAGWLGTLLPENLSRALREGAGRAGEAVPPTGRRGGYAGDANRTLEELLRRSRPTR